MPDFRCNMLDEHGHMLFPAEIAVENLDAAIQHASWLCYRNLAQ